MIPFLRRLLRRFTTLFRASRADADLQRELAAHAALLEDEYRRRGWPETDARREARLRLGSAAAVRDGHREARTVAWLEDAWRDAGYALRLGRRNPALAAIVVVSLAIGIGGNVAVFSVANALLFRAPDGVADADRLVDIGITSNGGPFNPASYPAYRDVEERATTMTGVFARQRFTRAVSLTIPGQTPTPVRALSLAVSANYFSTLGVTPAYGTWFDRDQRAATVVVSDRFRRAWFGTSPAIGRVIFLNGAPFAISGVLPEQFRGTALVEPDVWLPLLAAPAAHLVDPRIFEERRRAWLVVGARLKPGVSLATANAELSAISGDLDREHGTTAAPMTLVAATPSRLPGERWFAAVLLSILMALVSLVLLVACTNVTGVLLARADARRHEMAVRLSIGAGRARLVRQLLVETLLLFGIGALAGIATARGMMRGLVTALPALPVPLAIDVPLDLRVFAFTIGLSAMAAIASGLVPALRASKAHPASALKAESGGTSSRWRLRSAFVVGQASISVALVFTAVVFTRALVFAVSTDPGYNSRDVEIVTIDLSARGETPEASLPFWRTLIERVRQLPGVESASLARALPGGFETMGIAVAPPHTAVWQALASFEPDGNIVAPGYFKTMGIPLIAGRDFTSEDVAGTAPVTIVGEAAARHYWPDRPAVGQYLEETTPQGRRLRLVVGVVRDVRSSTLIDGVAQSVVYLPLDQERSGLISTMTVVARGSGTRAVAGDIRAVVASLNPNLPIVTTDTLRDSIALGLIPQRVVALVAASLGLASAILAAIGIYGVSSFAVSRRTREFGIRMALGATRRSILRMVLGQGVLLALAGTAIGIGLGAGAVKALTSFLFGIPALDPIVVFATIAAFTAIAAVACYGPARRAINVDPLAALRRE